MSEERKKQILKAIINHFVETAEPVGSNTILVSYQFHVSPATIRNDMMTLEEEGYIYQPHTSAGRIPTDKGYRLFVDEMADYKKARQEAIKALSTIREKYRIEKVREKLYDAVSLLARATNSVSFATTPDNPHTFFLGMSNVLRQPEFSQNSVNASEVMEVLERGDNFVKTLASLDVTENVRTFIGEENILPQIQSCSIVVSKYHDDGYTGYLGVLGPKRMNYAYNIVMVEEIKKLLNK
ncbi:DeoR family transcriptional regulator [Candidatus Peregrinibacteria bacterium]|nr:DeoR family transcriptional regulator [Candidatus Peregrinibacteria bacterium]